MTVVMTTTGSREEAESLAERLVEERLAACVQVLPQITSFYFWEGKVQKDAECLLLIKTLPAKYDEVEAFILSNHSYSVPEIVALDAARISESYSDWMKNYLT